MFRDGKKNSAVDETGHNWSGPPLERIVRRANKANELDMVMHAPIQVASNPEDKRK